jgi:hypothetical protein
MDTVKEAFHKIAVERAKVIECLDEAQRARVVSNKPQGKLFIIVLFTFSHSLSHITQKRAPKDLARKRPLGLRRERWKSNFKI